MSGEPQKPVLPREAHSEHPRTPLIAHRTRDEWATRRYTLLMKPDLDLVTRRAQIIAEIEESIAQLDRGEFVTEEQLRARFASERAARADSQAIPCPS